MSIAPTTLDRAVELLERWEKRWHDDQTRDLIEELRGAVHDLHELAGQDGAKNCDLVDETCDLVNELHALTAGSDDETCDLADELREAVRNLKELSVLDKVKNREVFQEADRLLKGIETRLTELTTRTTTA